MKKKAVLFLICISLILASVLEKPNKRTQERVWDLWSRILSAPPMVQMWIYIYNHPFRGLFFLQTKNLVPVEIQGSAEDGT